MAQIGQIAYSGDDSDQGLEELVVGYPPGQPQGAEFALDIMLEAGKEFRAVVGDGEALTESVLVALMVRGSELGREGVKVHPQYMVTRALQQVGTG